MASPKCAYRIGRSCATMLWPSTNDAPPASRSSALRTCAAENCPLKATFSSVSGRQAASLWIAGEASIDVSRSMHRHFGRRPLVRVCGLGWVASSALKRSDIALLSPEGLSPGQDGLTGMSSLSRRPELRRQTAAYKLLREFEPDGAWRGEIVCVSCCSIRVAAGRTPFRVRRANLLRKPRLPSQLLSRGRQHHERAAGGAAVALGVHSGAHVGV